MAQRILINPFSSFDSGLKDVTSMNIGSHDQMLIGDIKGDVIVYDDYSPNTFPGIVEAVDHICKDHGYKRHDISSEGERAYVIATKQ